MKIWMTCIVCQRPVKIGIASGMTVLRVARLLNIRSIVLAGEAVRDAIFAENLCERIRSECLVAADSAAMLNLRDFDHQKVRTQGSPDHYRVGLWIQCIQTTAAVAVEFIVYSLQILRQKSALPIVKCPRSGKSFNLSPDHMCTEGIGSLSNFYFFHDKYMIFLLLFLCWHVKAARRTVLDNIEFALGKKLAENYVRSFIPPPVLRRVNFSICSWQVQITGD